MGNINTFDEWFIGTRSGNTLRGTIHTTTINSLSNKATGEVTLVDGDHIMGSYSIASISGVFGTFDLQADLDLYNRFASLDKLEGTWVGTETTWVVQNNGSFTMSATNCDATGTFDFIDNSKNEYDLDVSLGNCDDANGEHSGIAMLYDKSNIDDGMVLAFSNSNGSMSAAFSLIKQ